MKPESNLRLRRFSMLRAAFAGLILFASPCAMGASVNVTINPASAPTGVIKVGGNGTAVAAVPGTDFTGPSSILNTIAANSGTITLNGLTINALNLNGFTATGTVHLPTALALTSPLISGGHFSGGSDFSGGVISLSEGDALNDDGSGNATWALVTLHVNGTATFANLTATGTVTLPSGISLTSPAISGGTINNTPIGATTKSTGGFTTLTATGTTTFPSAVIMGSFNETAIATGSILNTNGNGSSLTGLTSSQVGFTSTATGASATTLQAILAHNPLRLVADFGADPTGATDNHVQILAWLTAGCVTHRPLLAEDGTFASSTAITMPNGVATSNTYGDGFVMHGSGMDLTVFKFTNDTDGFVFPHAMQNAILGGDFAIQRTGSSTHSAIRTDGSVSEDGGIGTGISMNNCVIENVRTIGFNEAFTLFQWSNGIVRNCSIENLPAKGVHLSGSSNSNVFDTVSGDATVYTYELAGGQSCTIRGADINTPSGGTGIGIEVDGTTSVSVVNCRCENNGSNYAAEVQSGNSVNFEGCNFANFAGSAAWGLHCAGSVQNMNGGFGGATNSVRVEAGGSYLDLTNGGTQGIDYYSSGTHVGSWRAGPFISLGTNDGLTSSASTNGMIRFLSGDGSGEDELQFFSRNASGYHIDGLNAYNEDVRSAHVAKTNSGTQGDVIVGTSVSDGYSFDVVGTSHSSGTSLYGSAIIFDGKSSTLNYAIGYPFDFVTGDFAIYRSVAAGTVGLQGAAGTGQPNIPVFFIDGPNNRTSIGHSAASQPSGASTLNIEGSIAVTGLTAYAPIFGGTTTASSLQSGTVGTSGQVLTSNGAVAIATFKTAILPTVAEADRTADTATVTAIVSYTPGADGTFRVGCYATITAVATDTLAMTVNWTDETNSARTMSYFPQGLTSATLATTGAYAFSPVDIRAKSGNAITVKATVTGAGSITFDDGASIMQIK